MKVGFPEYLFEKGYMKVKIKPTLLSTKHAAKVTPLLFSPLTIQFLSEFINSMTSMYLERKTPFQGSGGV